MGWQDRGYSQSGYGGQPGSMMPGGFSLPRLTPMVKRLLIANVVVFVAQTVCRVGGYVVSMSDYRLPWDWLQYMGGFVHEWAILKGQIWRFVSYQYLHDSAQHLLWNMVGLYFLGSLMERSWGSRKFFLLYTLFGIAGAALFTTLVGVDVLSSGLMIGASGSILGLVGACAVAAPQVRVLVMFIFPVAIRTLAIIFAAFYVLSVMHSQSGADACHLGGLAVGAFWVWLEAKGIIRWPSRAGGGVGLSGRKWVQMKVRKGAWEMKMKRKQAQQAQIDRILKKVHEQGLSSLTRQEKKILHEASRDKT